MQSEKGRAVFIFPEGTRQEIGAPPNYKSGVAALYGTLGLPCVPVAMSTGLYWPQGITRRPGVAVVESCRRFRPAFRAKRLWPNWKRQSKAHPTACWD
ncbi:MAG: hypothetical protein WDN76_07035 [Alphaproteobacteria bacterium]